MAVVTHKHRELAEGGEQEEISLSLSFSALPLQRLNVSLFPRRSFNLDLTFQAVSFGVQEELQFLTH